MSGQPNLVIAGFMLLTFMIVHFFRLHFADAIFLATSWFAVGHVHDHTPLLVQTAMMLPVAGYVRKYAGMLGFAFFGVAPGSVGNIRVPNVRLWRGISSLVVTLVAYVVMWEVCGKSEL